MSQATKPGTIFVEVGAGELLDKMTILEIKTERIADPVKLANIKREIAALTPARTRLVEAYPTVVALEADLKRVNEDLWVIEDDIRACESQKDFGDTFIALARSVYIQNDKRAEIKKKINLLCEASIVEEKSYHGF
jgi:Family of unknown function (DUF6165)